MISQKMQSLVQNSSVIRAMFEEGNRLAKIYGKENVFDFSIGNPSVAPPAEIAQAIHSILTEEDPLTVHGYMNNSGYEQVRQSIADQLNRAHGSQLSAQNIVMTCGAAGGLNVLFKALLNPGDEVIVFAPFFGEYTHYVHNYDGELVVVPTHPDTFLPDLEALKAAVTAHTKAVILNTPNNPTGVVYPASLLKEMAEILEQKQAEFGSSIYVVSDEPYREIAYDGVEVPYILDYFRNGFIGYSYSKSLSLPGERIGYLAANNGMDGLDEILSALNVATRILGFVNAPSLFQKVIARVADLSVDVTPYRENRDLIYNHLISLGFSCTKPQGAFYLFPKAPGGDDKAFCEMAKKYNILVVPGSSFGCPGYFRLSYCVSREQILRSMPAFEKLAAELSETVPDFKAVK